MSWHNHQHTIGVVFWDPTGNLNNIAAFQAVSLATAAEVADAVAAGFGNAKLGGTVVPTPILGGAPTRRVYGITKASQVCGKEVSIAIEGIAEVMVNAAVAFGALVLPAAAATRTRKQTPFVNPSMFQALIPVAPDASDTYNLALADDTVITPASNGANAIYYPIGYALDVATNQYDVIPVQLKTAPIYA